MLRGFRLALATGVLMAVPAAPASAQYYGGYGGYGGGDFGWGGWGATPQGDIARGLGAYAQGVGVYNVNTAQANAINTDTMMRWNSYVWASQNSLNREHYARMIHEQQRNKAAIDAIEARIRDNPTKSDIEKGDALNAILHQLSDPRIHPSALRMTRVPVDSKWIQDIPFRYASEVITLSLHDLTSQDNWPLILKGADFAEERKAYQKAIEAALEEDKKGDLTPETIKAVHDAIFKLKAKVDKVIPKTSHDHYAAENFIKSLVGMARLLEDPTFDQALAALKDYPGTTVADLLGFMQMYNLRFGPANTPRQRQVYENLYPLLARQRDEIMKQFSNQANTTPPPPQGAPPTEIFHKMPWENLTGKQDPNAKKDANAKKDNNP